MRSPPRRSPGLDLVRAGAIVWVTVYHAATFGLVPDPGRWTVGFGWVGVDLFFALSGFLVARALFEPRARGCAPDHRRFFRHRVLRTLPAYAVVVAIYFALPGARERPDLQPLWQFATFTENWFVDLSTPKAFTHAWSLCVEEQFYVLLPLVVAALAVRPSARRACAVVLAIALGGVVLRGALWTALVGDPPFGRTAMPDWRAYMTWIYYPTWSRLDGLVAGVAMAAVRAFRPSWWRTLVAHPDALLAAGLLGIAGSIRFFDDQIASLLPAMFGFPALAWSCALVVVAASEPRGLVGRRPVPGAATVAAGAYSVYLVQKIAFHLASIPPVATRVPAGLPRLLVALALVAAIGAALYWTVERPCLRWRDRLDRHGPANDVGAVDAARAS